MDDQALALLQQIKDMLEKQHLPPSPIKLGEAASHYLKHHPNPSTRRSYTGVLNPLCMALGTDRYAHTITKAELEDYLSDLQNVSTLYQRHRRRPATDGHLSDATIRKHAKAIRAFWRWMLTSEHILVNPAQSLKSPALVVAIDHKDIPTLGETRLLFKYLYGKWMHYAIFKLLVDTGCRVGEIATLTLDDLDLETLSAVVVGKFNLRRTVFYRQLTARAVSRWLLKRPGWGHRYLFGTSKGHIKPDNITQIIRRACRELGIRDLSGHQFRHLRGSTLAAQGVSPKVIAKILGHHDDGETALRHYAQFTPQQIEEFARQTMLEDETTLLNEPINFPLKLAK